MSKKILVLGYARHGKDTAAKRYTANNPGTRFSSSSWFAANHFIFKQLCALGYGYLSVQECYDDRRNHRKLWHALIARYNADDPTRLARHLLKRNDIYVGMRAKREVQACFSAGLFDLCYWVDASQREGPESAESMDFGLDWVISCPHRKCRLIRIDNNNNVMTEEEVYLPN